MASDQDAVDRVVEELEQRGAEQPTVEGDISLAAFAGGKDQRDPSATVEYLGDPETVRHACRSLDGVEVLDVSTQPWPGGETEVQAEIVVRDAGSGGSNPGGNVDTSGSTTVPPPDTDEQDPHVPPGGTFPLTDDAGFTDQHEVEVWPVRWWEPRPDVQAVLVLRYVPAPAAQGLQWWAGYVQAGVGLEFDRLLDRLREKRIHAAGTEVAVDWHGGGWVGWSEASLPGEVAGVPVFSTVPHDWNGMGNQEAGEITTALAQAVLEARREVLG
ncbi:hypothetical protein M201_gp63 [Haloarcula californiae tailed virus 2]|uniref:Uncharacterized protein n=1 Tax=Haloarcula californiae tailed virus 2 TaxID=1273747 RepID=R4TM83_9CAUD|nr:hypothetical protein M201_gp63 [Haloarcula californiae tailed virus 2]AGM11832.1 hypothetical protein HCTV2_63 [Haloarcula californiae tailed virus 2]